MVRIITIGLISCFLFSCGNSKNFNKQKYTNLKKTKVNKSSGEEVFSNEHLDINSVELEEDQKGASEIYEEEQVTYSSNRNSVESKNEASGIFEQNNQKTQIDDNESFEIIGNGESNSISYSTTNSNNNPTPSDKKEKGTERNTAALWAFIFLCASIFLWPLPVAFILAIIAKDQIKRNPGKYRNKWMADLAFWFPIAFVVIFPIVVIVVTL